MGCVSRAESEAMRVSGYGPARVCETPVGPGVDEGWTWVIRGNGPMDDPWTTLVRLRFWRGSADNWGMALVQTSILDSGLRGKVGNAVFVRTPFGVSVRDYVIPRDPQTEAQMASRQRMRWAAAAWRSLTASQIEAWNDFASSLAPREPGDGRAMGPSGQRMFVRLATKFLQVSPGAAVPLDPPAALFGGDALSVVASGEMGAVRFAASGSNAPGVVTELLLQPVRTAVSRAYPERYRSQGFVPFSGSSAAVPVEVAGWYAAAYRFVSVATGEAGPVLSAGVVRVE